MKKFVLLVFFFAPLFSLFACHDAEIMKRERGLILGVQSEKVYVNPDKISLDKTGMSLQGENVAVVFRSLKNDEGGYYLSQKDFIHFTIWVCRPCRYMCWNEEEPRFYCPNCGKKNWEEWATN